MTLDGMVAFDRIMPSGSGGKHEAVSMFPMSTIWYTNMTTTM